MASPIASTTNSPITTPYQRRKPGPAGLRTAGASTGKLKELSINGTSGAVPKGGAPMGFPGNEFVRDEHSTMFVKIMNKYKLDDPGLQLMKKVNIACNGWFIDGRPVDHDDSYERMAYGIMAIADSNIFPGNAKDDLDVLDRSFVMYDSLYKMFKAEAACPPSTPKSKTPGHRMACGVPGVAGQ